MSEVSFEESAADSQFEDIKGASAKMLEIAFGDKFSSASNEVKDFVAILDYQFR
jgi:hypothetical protein